jgi:hypothetical protein
MLRTLALVAGAVTVLATAGTAQAANLVLGTSNASNATTTLTGNTSGAELKVVNANGSVVSSGVLGLLTATSPSAASAAVRGQNNATNGIGSGVYGSHAGAGIGVYGTSPRGLGVYGKHTDATGAAAAVRGDSASTAPKAYAVYGLLSSTNPGFDSAALRGESKSTTSSGIGVYGSQAGSGFGVYGSSANGSGVGGSGAVNGVIGTSTPGTGVFGRHFGATGLSPGVFGMTDSGASGAPGVKGLVTNNNAPQENSAGVYGENAGTTCCDRYGVRGRGTTGVFGQASIALGFGVYGTGYYGAYGLSGVPGGTGAFGVATGLNGNGVVGTANTGSNAVGVEGISADGYAGFFVGKVKVSDYLQLAVVGTQPPAADCNEVAEAGRMKLDTVGQKLWVCVGAGGWKSTNLS